MSYFLAFLSGATAPAGFIGESLVRIIKGILGLLLMAALCFFLTALFTGLIGHLGFDQHAHVVHCFWAAIIVICLGSGLIEVWSEYYARKTLKEVDDDHE